MEEVLKGLEGKSLTKKKLFDFLADINIEDLYGKKNNVIEPAAITEIITNPVTIEKKVEEIKCAACKKTFTAEGSLKRHYVRNPVCVNWISLPEKTESVRKFEVGGIGLTVDFPAVISKNSCCQLSIF